jgi:CTP:molybdopterin cytidylyltransferase MocA
MERHRHIAGIILAAGESRRFGSAKQLAPLDGRPLLEHVLIAATSARLTPVLVVAPPWLTLDDASVGASAEWVRNARPELGMSHSLQLGIAALPREVAAAVILLGDQPTVAAGHVAALLAARGERPIVATLSDGLPGPPVLLERSVFARAVEATGDAGLRTFIRGNPELVTAVPTRHPLPDVDEPSDLEALGEPCPGCGARFAPIGAQAVHPYLGASASCWAAFGELLAREFGDPAYYGGIHRHTVDAYAAQHPGEDGRRQRQSVALHLIGLCHWLEGDLESVRLNAITGRLTESARDWPWLQPPSFYEMTVLDVLTAADAEEHGLLVRRWAEAVWDAWRAHQPTVRRWAARAAGEPG